MNIYELKRQGKSVREISRITGHSRNTIRKYLKHGVQPRAKGQPQPSVLDPFKPYLDEQLARGVVNCNRLLREIRAQGYLVERVFSKTTAKLPRATLRFETQPGEQAQVDFGVFQFEDLDGRRRRLAAFMLVLSYSRASYVEHVEHQDLSTLLRCLVHSFEALGGVSQIVLSDNLKAVVQGRDS